MMQLVILALSLLMISMVDGLCMPEHIQTQFCNADYGKLHLTISVHVEYEKTSYYYKDSKRILSLRNTSRETSCTLTNHDVNSKAI